MKKLITLFILLSGFLISKGQLKEDSISVPVDVDNFQHYNALRLLPTDYATSGTKKYPLLIFLHGAGQGVPPLRNLYSTPDGGVPYQIEQGNWNGSSINPADGQTYQFIVISPQNNSSWSTSAQQLLYVINNLVLTHRVDTSRIYLTGLSAGGEGLVEYAYHLGVVPNFKFAAMVPMSEAGDSPLGQPWGATIVADSVRAWGFGDPINDIHGEFTQDLMNTMNTARAGFARFTQYSGGHCCWAQFYIPTYRETFAWRGVTSSMNIYEWMLVNTRNAAAPVTTPTASAGGNQSINLPTSSLVLNGSGTAGSGHTITSYAWTKVSGPVGAVITPATSTTTGVTTVSSLVAGVYDFRLTVTNNAAATAVSDAFITVNAAPPVVANAGADRTITLPSNSTLLDGSASTGTITSYSWTQLSGPNTAVLATPNNVTTTANGLIPGVYSFNLSINAGASMAHVQVTVNATSPYPPCGPGNKFTAVPNADTGWHVSAANGGVLTYQPGDTIQFPSSTRWVYISLEDFRGNPSCPLVLINSGGQTLVENLAGDTSQANASGHNGTLEVNNSWYVKVTGTGAGQQYGFKIEGDPFWRYDLGAAMQVVGNSRGVEVEHIFIHNIGTGFWSKNNGGCEDSLNYPAFVLDSVSLHDSKIVGTWNEGMYLGNTSPDNAPADSPGGYDPRPITCDDTTFYPIPPRIGHFHIYNNIVDSTGRGGIQLAMASGGISEIDHNTVMHNGINGDDAQGTAISTGTYTRAYIHDNICLKTYTWAIASQGGSGTGVPQRFENNSTDSSGYLPTYDLSNTSKQKIDPATEPMFADSLIWPQSIFIDTKPTFRPIDSTIVWIKNNQFGLCKGMSQQILIQNDLHTLQLTGGGIGNFICNNVIKGTTTPSAIFIDPTAAGFIYSTDCGVTPPPPPSPQVTNLRTRRLFKVH